MFRLEFRFDFTRLCLLLASVGCLFLCMPQPIPAQVTGPSQPALNIPLLGCPGQTPGPNPWNPCNWDAHKIMNAINNPHSDLVTVAAHRGTHALAGTTQAPGVPENSLQAIGLAAQEGWESIEIDVKLTSDGVPVLSHDKVWGREACFDSPVGYFNPFYPGAPGAIDNPIVDQTSFQFARPANGGVLRDSVSIVSSGSQQSCFYPVMNQSTPIPTLQDVYNFIKYNNIQMVVTLDIQGVDRATGAWGVVQNNTDYLGHPFYETTMFKIPAALFPNVAAYQQAFTTAQGISNSQYVNFNPVFHTSGIAPCMAASDIDDIEDVPEDLGDPVHPGCPNSFQSESNMIKWIGDFASSSSVYLSAIEVSMKDPPPTGILSTVKSYVNGLTIGGRHLSISSFNPVGEYWISGNSTPQFFSSVDGHCCEILDQFLFNNENHIQDTNPSQAPYPNLPYDENDNRTNVNFVVNYLGAQAITTDSPGAVVDFLETRGLRNVSYMQGATDPLCNPGAGQYPGCDADGTTVYTLCANEGGTCSFSGIRNVFYGADGLYNSQTVTNSISCSTSAFPPDDPDFGVAKACYYGPSIGTGLDRGVYCADEGGVCNYNGDAGVWFGADLSYRGWAWTGNYPNSKACNNAAFDGVPGGISDPAPGVVKTCFYQLSNPGNFAGPSGYVLCAAENQTCTFAGAAKIAFGDNGNFTYRTFSASSPESLAGGAACSLSEFADPAFGVVKACYYQYAVPVGSSGTGGGTGSGTSTCDLYASGGTPCVAAHSTVRALFGSYSGRLYQVTRASDGHTQDILTLAAGGYANAAAQNTFCAGTTCNITIIYDQTSNHNDLPVTAQHGAAVANALPISANLNAVYGLKVTPGVGYRNNATTGVATGSSPEGMYMVTSGTYVNSGCCFDYGNAETNSGDNGNGHMDAINFGTYCEFTCSGSGPWVEADLENGQYMGNGTNLSDVSMPFNFVTAMLKNDGKTTFALKGGNAQSGGLTADYSGTLPTGHTPSYLPMNLEGAVILGTGGDNSDADLGSFFEGAITSGYPTDATENAVQANIVTAGYACGSSGCIGSGGTTVVSEPPGPYTGPNDPGGPGPQDGFASPSIEQPNVFMGSKPALASFQGSLFVAFQANDPGHTLHVTSSPTGYNFPAAAQQPNVLIGSAPAMAAFNDQLYIAFQANDPGHTLHVTSSPTGYNFPAAAQEPNILIGSAPAMAVFNGQLCISFQANDPGHTLHVTCSPDGVNWPTAWQVPNVAIGSAPAMTVFRGMLYVAFLANDPSNDVWIASSTDGVNFSSQVLAGQTMDGNSSPALVVSNNVLYYIYEANDTDHEMLVTASADGSNWQGPAAYLGIQMGAQGPGAAAFGNGVSVGFQSNDSRNVLFITNKVTEASSYTGPSDPNGSGPQDDFSQTASLQSNIFMGSKPALASFNGGVFVAFRANDSGHTLHITSSPDGITFPAATQQPNVQMGSAPAIAEFKGILYVAFQANDAGHTLHVTSSPSGYNFPAAAQEPNIQIGGAPAMAVFNNKLYLAFQANDPGHTLHVTASADGVTWPSAWQIPNIAIGSDPAMAVVNGKLYIAFRADDPSNDVWIASSSDGVNFTSQVLAGQTMGGSSSPALAVSLGELFYIYGANDLGNEMLVTESNDGSTWQGPAAYTGTQMGATGPGATAFGAGVSVGFQSNDSRNALFITKGTLFSTTINVRPCDLLASASPATPCVAAYSTIRRLYSAYTGPLYRVTRASDSTSSDIGLLGDGYASAQTQDSFCVKTFCSITKIYDQTSNHNDLTAAPPGQNGSGPAANGFDNVAPATAAPMFAGGHKVYGLYSQPGYGYRNDATKGIPSKGAPEGVYMLTSAKGLVPAADINGACCFDFGNAETTNNDDLAGHMDAMRVACIGSPCVPVSGLDMENGTYGNVPGVAGTAVMIAMGWNDGQHNFSTYIGDPLIGNLVSTGTLPLPGGYAPMQQEGAIILGIGGDNSNGASGYFYEGAMTQGAPSSASLSSVRASAGLPGFQFPTGSPAGLVEDGGTYTIENQASQMYLDNYCDGCSGVAPTNGVQVIQYPGNGWLTQTWTLHGQGNGYYTMVNAQSGMCLDDPWGNGTPSRTLPQSPGTSTMLWQQPCNGNAAQNWEFLPQSNGNFVIQNQAATTNNGSPMVLDVYNGLSIQGMQMWVSTANGLPPQNWHLAHQ